MGERLTLCVEGKPDHHVAAVPEAECVPFRIGRDPASDLVLPVDWVSRAHCHVGCDGGGRFWVEDLRSREGTAVNGHPVAGRHPLADGDTLSVGGVDVRVRITTPATPAGAGTTASATRDRRPPHRPGAVGVPRPAEPPPAWDATVVADPRRVEAAAAGTEVVLGGRSVTLGRDPTCECRFDSPMVSRRHAFLRPKGNDGGYVLEDAGSANGTFVNGVRVVKPQPVAAGDVIAAGPFRMTFDGARLVPRSSADGVSVVVRGLGKRVRDRTTGRPLWLLRDVGLTIPPRQFVVLLGGSGCGKSTFMDAVNGRRPANRGTVLYNGEDLYARFDSLKSLVGYVPQDVIFHDGLGVAAALSYAARLRLPGDTTAAEVADNVDRVLRTVGLADRRATRIRDLSGGQKKRVSIAMELLSRPQVLFLDEVTSGLDLGTERQMMQLFRTLADDGVTVVCITHHLDSLAVVDRLAYFAKGRLAFLGPPAALPAHFGVAEIREVYEAEKARDPAEWERRYRATPDGRAATRAAADPASTAGPATAPASSASGTSAASQFAVLTRRYVDLLRGEYRNLLLLVGLAPAVTAMLCLLAGSIGAVDHPATADEYRKFASQQNLLCFGSVIITLFLGLFASVREVVKEQDVLRHERFLGLRTLPYLLSKTVPLAAVGLVVATLVAVVAHFGGGLRAGGFGLQWGVLAATSVAGTVMGLAVSAAVPTSDWATLCMIGLVIPEILFSGALVPARGPSGAVSKSVIASYWSERALLGQLDDTTRGIIDPDLPAGDAGLAVGIVGLHAAVLFGAAWLFLLAKDAHGPVGRAIAAVRGRGDGGGAGPDEDDGGAAAKTSRGEP